jgi:Na+/proline symporter
MDFMQFASIWLACTIVGAAVGLFLNLLNHHFLGDFAPVSPTVPPEMIAGVILGLSTAIAARVGSRPPRTSRSLVRPGVIFTVILLIVSALVGLLANMLAQRKGIQVNAPEIPVELHPKLVAVQMARTAFIMAGFIGGGIQVAVVWASRRFLPRARP